MTNRIYLGDITSAHGISGEVRLHVIADSPDFARQFKKLYTENNEYSVSSCRVHKNVAILTLNGVNSREAAERLIGCSLFFERSDAKLKKGQFFIADILGFEVLDADNGTIYGCLTKVDNHGSADVYHIEKDGKTYLFPAAKPFIDRRDFDEKRIYIRTIPGMFDEDDV